MGINNLVIEKIEQTIYLYVVNIASFLKSLKKNDIANEETQKLAQIAGFIHSSFAEVINSEEKEQIIILENIIKEIEVIQQILIKNFEEINKNIMHEKADLMIDSNNLIKDIKLLLN